jgi:hypothetical protein
MYVCMYACMHAYMHACIHTCMQYSRECIYIHRYSHTYKRKKHTYGRMQLCKATVPLEWSPTCRCLPKHTQTYIHTQTSFNQLIETIQSTQGSVALLYFPNKFVDTTLPNWRMSPERWQVRLCSCMYAYMCSRACIHRVHMTECLKSGGVYVRARAFMNACAHVCEV